MKLPEAWHNSPKEFSLAPFWFWNDRLEDAEIARQLDEFQAHGVDAFVIHPRVGLPRDTGWMSENLLSKMRFAIQEAEKRDMWVILYDEGMYPSGSSSGQVVAENAAFQCRGLVRINLDMVKPNSVEQGIQIDEHGQPVLAEHQTLIATVDNYAIIQRPVKAIIRGLHFIHEDSKEPPEDEPLAIDLLNPDAVRCFIRLVYQRYYEEFGDYFGTVIQAIFTDEPMLLGRLQEIDIVAGTVDCLDYANEFLGYDFTPYLPQLWDAKCPAWITQDYERALERRLEQTYYVQLNQWCEEHYISLTGHPAEADATRHLRYFHIPGQDIVWRFIEPDKPSALEGRQSTQGKAASSMMLHTGRRRNANEFCGAYGHSLTFEEMRWLAHWLLIRGCNFLIPHAFYYSIRGPRYYERPPDIGLHSHWWDERFTEFAIASRRLSWLNTDSQHICHVAILGEHHHLPWRGAKGCFQNQIDFNYLDIDDLQASHIQSGKLHIAEQDYYILIVDGEMTNTMEQVVSRLTGQMPIVHWSDDTEDSIGQVKAVIPTNPFSDIDARGLRVRHLKKADFDWYILFNEEKTSIQFQVDIADSTLVNPYTGDAQIFSGDISLAGHDLRIIIS